MSRFLYRIWDNSEKKMVHEDLGAYCNFDKGIECCYDDAVLMQCTGMLDTNLKQIYESDFVKYTYDSDLEQNIDIALVEWKAEWCCFYIGNRTPGQQIKLSIIGNKYENPELSNLIK